MLTSDVFVPFAQSFCTSTASANILKERAKQRVQDHTRHAEHQKADKQVHWFSPFTKCMTFASGVQDGR